MPPPDPAPQEPKKETPPAGAIDISKILLPKKETGPTPESAQRINAGALLEQEQNATLPKPELPQEKVLGSAPPQPDHFPGEVPAQTAPATPPTPKVERPEVSPLQTYKGDVEKSVSERGVSVVSVAAAEAERRGKQGQTPEAATAARRSFGMKAAMTAVGVLLIVIAAGVVSFIFLRPTTVQGPQTPVAPFMSVDDTALVTGDLSSRDTLVTNIAAAVQSVHLSVGLIEWLYIAPPLVNGTVQPETSVQDLLGTLAPDLPADLARTLQPAYMLGVHSYDQNQPFLILQTDSYETAYSGMLAWESTMQKDLSPIFNRTPSPHLNSTDSLSATTTATSTDTATSGQFVQSGFVDQVVENRDARVILNPQGDILLLWTMLGRNTILITTNEYTLREVVSRMNTAPIVPIPAQ